MHTQRHRHIVAVPLVALAMLVIAGVNQLMPLHAALGQKEFEVQLDATRDQPFHIGTGMRGYLYAGSSLFANRDGTHVTLDHGQAIFSPTEYTELGIGDVRAFFDSSVFVIRDNPTTVVALKHPIIVAVQNTHYVVLFGQQLLIDPTGAVSLTSVSSAWFAETLSQVPDAARDDDVSRITLDTYQALLRNVDAATDQRRLLLLRLMNLGTRTDDDAADLLTADVVNDSFLISALPRILPELVLLSGTPVQTPLIPAWADSIIESGVRDGTGVSELLSRTVTIPSFLEEIGYPVHAALWRSALLRVITTLKPTVSGDASVLLSQAQNTLSANMHSEENLPAPVAEKPLPSTQWTFDELRAITHDALVHHGALIATSTALVPDITSQVVIVQGVYVAEDGRDVPYTFTYDPALQELRSIIRDGKHLPNTVPIDVFFE